MSRRGARRPAADTRLALPGRYALGEQSEKRLATCHSSIIAVVRRAIASAPVDFCVHEGHRTLERQQQLYCEGASKCDGLRRKSKHQSLPSHAVDLLPWPIDWNDRERFALLAGCVLACAAQEGVRLRFGADWDSDGNLREHPFRDYPHYELYDVDS